jgi:hypothetical protein
MQMFKTDELERVNVLIVGIFDFAGVPKGNAEWKHDKVFRIGKGRRYNEGLNNHQRAQMEDIDWALRC